MTNFSSMINIKDQTKIQAILDNLLIPFIICNEKTEILYANQAFFTFSGLTPRKLKKVPRLIHSLSTNQLNFEAFLKEAFSTTVASLSEEIKMTFAEDSISQYGVIRVIPMESNLFAFCFNNLSVEHNLYEKYKEKIEELKKTHHQIIQADKLATMGELTAGISHEISNPLTIAMGNVEVLEMSLAEETKPDIQEIKTYITNINGSLKRISAIIENMKEYLHKSEDSKEYCQYEDVIQNSINLVGPAFREKKVDLIKTIQEPHMVGLINKIKIEQVIINLLKNALDAISSTTESKGRVEINLKKDPTQNSIIIEVLDNGPGISPEAMKELFTPFFTTKKVGEGMGLGLSISNKIIESHHGKILVSNREKTGACFQITLPILENISFTNNERYLTGITHREDFKVLVIDNDVVILNVLNKILAESGLVFIGSTNGEEALKFLQKFQTDLIITDIEMPEMKGSEFAKLVRERDIQTPIIYFSSESNRTVFEKDKKNLNICDFILKPFTANQVMDILKKYLRKEKQV